MKKELGGIKQAQLEISFGMIFSIILIIAFLGVAIFVIYKFMGLQGTINKEMFTRNLQDSVTNMWKDTNNYGSVERTFDVPDKITLVCFADLSQSAKPSRNELYQSFEEFQYANANMFFYPLRTSEGNDYALIQHLNLNDTIEKQNPFCVKVVDGKVNFVIKKNLGEGLVRIKENV